MSKLLIMHDIETLSLSTIAVVTQLGYAAADSLAPTEFIDGFTRNLPAQPQLDIGRDIQYSTLLFWLRQPEESRNHLLELDGDADELKSILKRYLRGIEELVAPYRRDSKPVEFWARGPQFDMANLAGLLAQFGLPVPWRYDEIRDLRTLMAEAGVKSSAVERRPEWIMHSALGDSKFQLGGYEVAQAAFGQGR